MMNPSHRNVKRLALLLCAGFAMGLLATRAQGQNGMPTESAGEASETGAIQSATDTTAAEAPPIQEVAGQTAGAIGQAASEVGGALRTGGQSALDQGRRLWQEAMLPAFQRTAASVPILLKGLLLLLAFWIAGILLGGGVRRLLDMTKLDEKAARDWGLEGMLKRPDGQTRSLAAMLGGVIKWILLLFGFVAFFNTLNLAMVATPLQRVLDSVVGIVPNLLKATVILLVYWAFATIARMAIVRVLKGFKFDERAGKRMAAAAQTGDKAAPTPPSTMLGRLAFYVILLFGLPPFLQALGQDALVTPLQEMLAKALGFLPNIVAAGIILLVGRIVASIVKEVVGNLLAASGLDKGIDKLGVGKALGGRSFSDIVSKIVYFFILIPIIVAAVDSLGITVISDPIKATLQAILAAVPALIVATVIVIVGCVVARVVRSLVASFLAGVGFDALPERIGLNFLTPRAGQMSLSGVVGAVVSVIIILITAQQAAATLKFAQLADLVRQVIEYLPSLVVGLVIMLAALSLAKFVAGLVSGALKGQANSRLLAAVARYAITLLGAGMALEQLGVGQEIVTVAIAAILGGAALALGLAFGLGGKDRARDAVDRWSNPE